MAGVLPALLFTRLTLDEGRSGAGHPELGGHADLSTTQRYMHLSPAATEDAIRLLDGRQSGVVLAEKPRR
jgi:hypothetical protein